MSDFIVAHRLAALITYHILFVAWGNLAISKHFGWNDICLIEYKEEYDAWFPYFTLFIMACSFFVNFLYAV